MPDLATLILTHYICNALAAQNMLPTEEILRCNHNYAALKASFEPGLAEPNDNAALHRALSNAAYTKWKTWEAENAEIVAPLRAEALALTQQRGGS